MTTTSLLLFPNQLVTNPEITGFELAVLGYFKTFSQNVANEPYYVAPSSLSLTLFHSCRTIHITKVEEALQHLSKELPQMFKKVSSHYLYQPCDDKELFYVNVPFELFKKILSMENGYGLLKLYCVILSAFKKNIVVNNCKFFASDFNLSWYQQRFPVNMQTLTKYFKTLEDMKLIYVVRTSRKNNLVGKYEHKNLIDEWGGTHGYKITNVQTNLHRSLMQKYNRILKLTQEQKEIPYTKAEIIQIKEYLEEKNHATDKWESLDPSYEGTTYNTSVLHDILKIKGVTS